MGKTVGVVTLGQTPVDDVIAEIMTFLDPDIDVLQVGVLDDLPPEAIDAVLAQNPDDAVVAWLRGGDAVLVDRNYVYARLGEKVLYLEERGADLILIMSTDEVPLVEARGFVLYPHRLLRAAAEAALPKGRLGVVSPHHRAWTHARRKWSALGKRVCLTLAPPEASMSDWSRVAEELHGVGARLVVLDDFAYSAEVGTRVAALTRLPVMCARTVAARFLAELL